MILTKEQIKEAKKILKANGLNPALVSKEIGNGFWIEECNSSFEGYVNHLLNSKNDGSILKAAFEQSTKNYHSGKSGLSSLTK